MTPEQQKTTDAYRALFVGNPVGHIVLSDLIARFARPAVLDGHNAALKTYYNAGMSEVLAHIQDQVDQGAL